MRRREEVDPNHPEERWWNRGISLAQTDQIEASSRAVSTDAERREELGRKYFPSCIPVVSEYVCVIVCISASKKPSVNFLVLRRR
jgi:hypothetical protein